MAVPLLSHEHVVQQLWRRNCQLVKDYGHHALWTTTKIKHHSQSRKRGPTTKCSAYVFEEILKEIDTLQGPPD
jgi:hypothetical protein